MFSFSMPQALMALLQLSILAKSTTGLAFSLHDLLPRDTCDGQANYTTCGHGLPSNFCCATGEQCIPLNNTGVSAAAICCPANSDCSTIATITCNVTYQDPSKFPTIPLHISNTSVSLPTCGNNCCPLGYECTSSNECKIKDSTKQAPSSTSSFPTAASATSSKSSSSRISASQVSSTSTSTAIATSSPISVQPTKSSDNTSKKNTAGLVLAGLFPGLILGALVVAGILFYLKRRKEKKAWKSDSSSSFFGPPTPHPNYGAPKISSPIYQPGMSDRTVFGHSRTASGNTIHEGLAVVGTFYKPSGGRSTTDSATLVSPTQHIGSAKKVRTLDPPFESPTRPPRAVQRPAIKPIRGLFKSPSVRTTNSRRTARRSAGSMETISMLMGPPTVPSYEQTPDARQTTYSDVYRAAGISPSKIPRSVRPSEDTQRGQ